MPILCIPFRAFGWGKNVPRARSPFVLLGIEAGQAHRTSRITRARKINTARPYIILVSQAITPVYNLAPFFNQVKQQVSIQQ